MKMSASLATIKRRAKKYIIDAECVYVCLSDSCPLRRLLSLAIKFSSERGSPGACKVLVRRRRLTDACKCQFVAPSLARQTIKRICHEQVVCTIVVSSFASSSSSSSSSSYSSSSLVVERAKQTVSTLNGGHFCSTAESSDTIETCRVLLQAAHNVLQPYCACCLPPPPLPPALAIPFQSQLQSHVSSVSACLCQ